MKLKDIIGGAAAIAGTLNPAIGAAIGLVNGFLPDDKKLPETATGSEVANAIQTLPPGQQASLLEKEIDLETTKIKESNETVRMMLESDAKNPHSTRPYIAKHSFHVVAFTIIIVVSLWAYAVGSDKQAMVKTIMEGWPFILGVLGPLVVLLRTYFGVLKQEQSNKLNAANKQPVGGGMASLVAGLIKK